MEKLILTFAALLAFCLSTSAQSKDFEITYKHAAIREKVKGKMRKTEATIDTKIDYHGAGYLFVTVGNSKPIAYIIDEGTDIEVSEAEGLKIISLRVTSMKGSRVRLMLYNDGEEGVDFLSSTGLISYTK